MKKVLVVGLGSIFLAGSLFAGPVSSDELKCYKGAQSAKNQIENYYRKNFTEEWNYEKKTLIWENNVEYPLNFFVMKKAFDCIKSKTLKEDRLFLIEKSKDIIKNVKVNEWIKLPIIIGISFFSELGVKTIQYNWNGNLIVIDVPSYMKISENRFPSPGDTTNPSLTLLSPNVQVIK